MTRREDLWKQHWVALVFCMDSFPTATDGSVTYTEIALAMMCLDHKLLQTGGRGLELFNSAASVATQILSGRVRFIGWSRFARCGTCRPMCWASRTRSSRRRRRRRASRWTMLLSPALPRVSHTNIQPSPNSGTFTHKTGFECQNKINICKKKTQTKC